MHYEQALHVLACDTSKVFNFNYQAKSFQFVSTTANITLTEKRKTLGSAGARKMQNLSTRPRDVSHDRLLMGFCAAVERVNLSKRALGQQSNQDSDVLGLGQQVTRTSI